MFGINGYELLLLPVVAAVVLGPDRMPEYAAQLARSIRKMRVMADDAKVSLKDQLGPEYQDLNWRQYDPRQYDPRRIVREALLDPLDEAVAPVRQQLSDIPVVGDGQSLRSAVTGAMSGAAATAAVSAADDSDASDSQSEAGEPVLANAGGFLGPTPYDPEAT